MRLSQLGTFLFILLVVSPFLFAVKFYSSVPVLDSGDVFWGFRNSFLQSLVSAFCAVVLGIFFARALVSPKVPQSILKILQIFLLTPLFLPTLVVCLVLLLALDPFPFGNIGIIVTHLFVFSGVVGVSLSRVLIAKLGPSADVAMTLGSGQFLFWRKIVIPAIFRDLLVQFGLIFAACFSSFSVPLLMGGGKAENVEILIYESIRNSGDWSGALLLTLAQLLILFTLSYFLQQNRKQAEIQKVYSTHPLFSTRFDFYLASGFVIFLFIYLIKIFILVLSSVSWATFLQKDLFVLSGGTFVVSLLSLLMTGFLFFVFLYLSEDQKLHQFLSSYFAPSTALGALAVAAAFGSSGAKVYFVIAFILSLFCFPILYKLFWESDYKKILKLWEVSKTLGASRILTVRHVLFPFARKSLERSLLLVLVWASSDFAISRVVSLQEETLAMRIDRLLGSYYFEGAFLILLVLAGVVLFSVLLLKGVMIVSDRKS